MLKRALLALLVAYTILLGGTYSGILSTSARLIDAILLGAVVVAWLWLRRRWTWHRTPLDWAILIWCAAFALALVANLDTWRRIVIGLYFMGIYVGAWYVLQDMLANRALRREWLVDALLIAGVPIVFVGYAQVEVALTGGLPLPRPVGTLGNANTLAAFLVMLLPFTVGRLWTARSPLARVALGLYAVGTLGLIGLSFSRGGWIAAAAALAVWVSLSFPLRHWWAALPRWGKAVLIAVGVVVAAVGLVVIIDSFGIGGRGLDLRTWIYETAITMFRERPLTGYGLFTFGAGLSRLNSLPPGEPHSHAHNIILHVAAELGIVGLIALALTAWIAYRAIRRARDPVAIMGAAAFVGFAVHQMFDLPAMMPTIALVALVALVLIAPAGDADAVPRARWQPALLALGGVALTVIGLWSALTYNSYIAALQSGSGGDFRAAADQLAPLAAADPDYAVYPQQMGLLYGLAAAAGDSQAAQLAADRFARMTQLDPDYASGWANLAAMDEAAGDSADALTAIKRAAQLAPQSWSILYRYGNYAESAGDTADAQQVYQQAVALGADITLIPDWDQSPLRRAIQVDPSQLTPLAQALVQLEAGDTAAARATWEGYPDHGYDASNYHVMSLLIALSEGNRERAALELTDAERVVVDNNGRAWTEVGAALLNPAAFDQQIAAANAIVSGQGYGSDWELGANINYIQYLTLAIPRQFVPQVGYHEVDQALLHLLGSPDALAKVRAAVGD